MKERIRNELRKYKYAWPLLYVFIYMPWFIILEKIYTADYPGLHIIHSVLDDYIPFNEWFIIPYVLWYLYIPAIYVFLFYHSKNEFYRLCAFEFTGMTLALLFCTIYPNGLNLRPEVLHHDNILSYFVQFIYHNDTSTNVCPSMHVFGTLAAHICLVKSPHMRYSNTRKWIKVFSAIMAVLICISTVTLKQHSIIDVFAAIGLTIVLYFVVFYWWFKKTDFPEPKEKNPKKHQVLYFLNKKRKDG